MHRLSRHVHPPQPPHAEPDEAGDSEHRDHHRGARIEVGRPREAAPVQRSGIEAGVVRKGGFAHSNTAENYFSIFKRGVIGTYHHMSEAHLGRYCREFDLRYNTREMTDGERAAVMLKGMEGKRLTYRRTDAIAA